MAAILAVGLSCSDEDLIFPGGPPGPATTLDIANSDIVLVVGQTTQVGAAIRDSAGNPLPTAASITACDAKITVAPGTGNDAFNTVVDVTAASLGTSCLNVSGAGLSDSVGVVVGPAGVTITGPDTVGSGNAADFVVNAFSASGGALSGTTPYEWSTSTQARLVVDPATGQAQGRGTGTVAVRLRAPGGAAATKSVVVVPGVFGGTLSSSSGAPGMVISIARAADGAQFDSDTQVRFGGVLGYLDEIKADSLFFAVPATGATGSQTLAMTNVGPDQLAQNTSWTSNLATTDAYAANNAATCQAPGTTPELSSVLSRNGNVYLVHGGFGTGSASRSCTNGGSVPQVDHYFKVTTGATALTLDLLLEWRDGSDVDILICDGGVIDPNTLANCSDASFSGSSTQEALSGAVFPANSTNYVVISMWSAGSNITNLKLNVSGL